MRSRLSADPPIFNRDAGLRDLRRGHRAAIDSGDAATARLIGIQIGNPVLGGEVGRTEERDALWV